MKPFIDLLSSSGDYQIPHNKKTTPITKFINRYPNTEELNEISIAMQKKMGVEVPVRLNSRGGSCYHEFFNTVDMNINPRSKFALTLAHELGHVQQKRENHDFFDEYNKHSIETMKIEKDASERGFKHNPELITTSNIAHAEEALLSYSDHFKKNIPELERTYELYKSVRELAKRPGMDLEDREEYIHNAIDLRSHIRSYKKEVQEFDVSLQHLLPKTTKLKSVSDVLYESEGHTESLLYSAKDYARIFKSIDLPQAVKILGVGSESTAIELEGNRVLKISTTPLKKGYGSRWFDIPILEQEKKLKVPGRKDPVYYHIQPKAESIPNTQDHHDYTQDYNDYTSWKQKVLSEGNLDRDLGMMQAGRYGGKIVLFDYSAVEAKILPKTTLLSQIIKTTSRAGETKGIAKGLAAFNLQLSNKQMPRRMMEAINQAKRINPLFKYLDGPEGSKFFDAASGFAGSHKLIRHLFDRKKRAMSKSVQMSGTLTEGIIDTAKAEPALKVLENNVVADLHISKSIKTIFSKVKFLKFLK